MKPPMLVGGDPWDLNLLHRCANCDADEDESPKTSFQLCADCREAFYCSTKCQSEDWHFHSLLCAERMSWPGGKCLRALVLPHRRRDKEWKFLAYNTVDAAPKLKLTRDKIEQLLPKDAVWFEPKFSEVCRLLERQADEEVKTMTFVHHPLSGKTFSKTIKIFWIDRYYRDIFRMGQDESGLGELRLKKDVLAVGLQFGGTGEIPKDWNNEDLKTIWDARRYDMTMHDAAMVSKWLRKHRNDGTGPWADIEHTVVR